MIYKNNRYTSTEKINILLFTVMDIDLHNILGNNVNIKLYLISNIYNKLYIYKFNLSKIKLNLGLYTVIVINTEYSFETTVIIIIFIKIKIGEL